MDPGRTRIWKVDGTYEELHLNRTGRLGSGLSSDVYKTERLRDGLFYAEKEFREPGGLEGAIASLLYEAVFQAPPAPYSLGEHPVRAALHKRRVIRRISRYEMGEPLVSDAYYTRVNEKTGSNVMGTELIEGRPPLPPPVDNEMIYRWVFNAVAGIRETVTGKNQTRIRKNVWEMDKLIKHMNRFSKIIYNAGFETWQSDPWVSRPAGNFLKRNTDGKWAKADEESGVPAIHPKYLLRSLKTGNMPLFDDVDFGGLNRYVNENRKGIKECLGKVDYEGFLRDVEMLEFHTREWKCEELARFRKKEKPYDRKNLRKAKGRWIEYWGKNDVIDDGEAEKIMESDSYFFSKIRKDIKRHAKHGMDIMVDRMWEKMKKAGKFMYSALFDEDYLDERVDHFIDKEIERQVKRAWIDPGNARKIGNYLKSDEWVKENIKGAIAHMDLKIIDPPVIGDFMWVGLWALTGQVPFLIPAAVSPVLRSGYTISRVVKKKRVKPYIWPFIGGALPKAGFVSSYIPQLIFHSVSNEYDTEYLLSRGFVDKIGRHTPIIGSEDSVWEHELLKLIDPVASAGNELRRVKRGKKR